MVEPFWAGSHQQWAEGLMQHSRHDFRVLQLPGRYWKWRMHGGAVELVQEFLANPSKPAVILASDMLDLGTFLALTRAWTHDVPVVLYFHENQLTYPWSPSDQDPAQQRDRHYAWINYQSALAADQLWFNSAYHRDSFLSALPEFLKGFPDYPTTDSLPGLEAKSQVMPLGLTLPEKRELRPPNDPPVMLWNHRWEYDKGPEAFFRTLFQLVEEEVAFQLVVLGESYRKQPPIFQEANKRLADHLLHWGFVKDRKTYWEWVHQADVLPVTTQHDFFGISVVEAIAAGVYPLLPNRLAYPEHIPQAYEEAHLYEGETELLARLREFLQAPVSADQALQPTFPL